MKKLLLIGLLMVGGLAGADTGDIPLSSNFQLNSQRSLDARLTVDDATARNAIPTIQRYDGMTVYQRSDNKIYQLQGAGLTTWVELPNAITGGSGGGYPLETMVNDLSISSPTRTQNFKGTASAIQLRPGVSGSTATITFDLLPGNTQYLQNPSTGTYVNTAHGIVVSTITANDDVKIQKSNLPTLTIEKNSPGADSGQIEYTTLGTQKAALVMGAGGFDVKVTTGPGVSPVARISVSNQSSNNAQMQFNPSNSGFTLKESSVTFDSGTRDPIMDWSTDGRVKFFAPEGLSSQYNLQGGSLTVVNIAGGGTQCVQADNNGLFSGTGAACGSGGGGSGGYSVEPATVTFNLALGVTASTGVFTSSLNVTGLLTGTTIQASSAAISNVYASTITVQGTGGGFFEITEGAARSGSTGKTVLWSDSSSHLPKFIPNNGQTFSIVGSSVTTTANKCAQWSGDGTLIAAGDACGTGSGGGGYATIQDEGSAVTQRTTLNMIGSGVSCVDNSGSSRTDCTINSGSGSPSGSNYAVQVSSGGSFGHSDALQLNQGTVTFSTVNRVQMTNLSTFTTTGGVPFNLNGSTVTAQKFSAVNSTATRMGATSYTGYEFDIYNSGGEYAGKIFGQGALGDTFISLNPVHGVKINAIDYGTTSPDLLVGGSSASPGDQGSFGVVGSSANAAATFSGFTSTNNVDASTLWSLPRKDGTAGQALVTDGSTHLSFATLPPATFGQSWDGGGSVITTGETYWTQIKSSGTITGFTISGLPSGSVTVDVQKSAAFNSSPTSICASACPSLTAQTNRRDVTLTGWTTAIAKDSWLYFIVNTASTVTKLNLTIDYVRQ